VDLNLADKAFIVTGASQGLGLASAQAMAADGARIVLVGRDADRLTAAASTVPGGAVVTVVGDLADPDLADRLVRTSVDTFGRLDGAVISVGGPPIGSVASITDEQWRTAFDSVFLGAVRVCRAVHAHAVASSSPASLVLVLSTSVKAPVDGLATSNGLRPGLGMLVKTMADEWSSEGVRVNAVLPGRILTSRLEALEQSFDDPAAARAAITASIPMGRYGTPEEFGAVTAFIASPAAGYVNGAMIPVDGGATRAL
jgi:3-oxoacyl-[acyl-carrier protein] reductase